MRAVIAVFLVSLVGLACGRFGGCSRVFARMCKDRAEKAPAKKA